MVSQRRDTAAKEQSQPQPLHLGQERRERSGGGGEEEGHVVWIGHMMRLTGLHLGTVTVKEIQYFVEEVEEDATGVT